MTNSDAFERAVRELARREGHPVADDAPVVVEYGTSMTGYSEYTITSTWDELEVTCGDFVRIYGTPQEYQVGGHNGTPMNAFALLLADLDAVPALPVDAAVTAATVGVPPWEAVNQYAADPAHAMQAWRTMEAMGAGAGVPRWERWEQFESYNLDWDETRERDGART